MRITKISSKVKRILNRAAVCAVVGAFAVNSFGLTVSAAANKSGADKTTAPQKSEEIFPGSSYYYLDETKYVKPYIDKAEKRKQAIINSKTEIVKSNKLILGKTYTGTAYYVSVDGDFNNSGKSPESPWNIDRVNQAKWRRELKKGDAVFFKRGDVFRLSEDALFIESGVTYSAYGKGAKPVFTLAQENSAREECWKLYYKDKSGKKVWKFYKDLSQTAGIFFDDNTFPERVWEFPTPKGWETLKVKTVENLNSCMTIEGTGKYLSPAKALKKDMTFITRTDISGIKYPYYPNDFNPDNKKSTSNNKWELYLRCDKGNPGTLYKDIEVIAQNPGQQPWLIYAGISSDSASKGNSNYVIDNFDMRGYIDTAVGADIFDCGNGIVQNCIVEWGGNRLSVIQAAEPKIENMWLIGDSVYGLGRNSTVRNNYFYQSSNAPTFEEGIGAKSKYKNLGTFTCTGNVAEYCSQGIRLSLEDESTREQFEKIIIKDNYILYTGETCFNNACAEYPAAVHMPATYYLIAKKFVIENNVFLGSTGTLMRIPSPDNFEGALRMDWGSKNVFIQKRGGYLAVWGYSNKIESIKFKKEKKT